MLPTSSTPVLESQVDRLRVLQYRSRAEMDAAAGATAALAISAAIERQGGARIILASAPSQTGFLQQLLAHRIPWEKVTVFHMDEYVGLEATHPASFRRYQSDHVLNRIQPAAFHGICGESDDPIAETHRYAGLLAAAPIDVVCAGIGENGHLAFNDPPADLHDPECVKIVTLDEACRRQQVNDGCFERIEAVPATAITLTVPALLAGGELFVIVPGSRKAEAVKNTLKLPISGACPATSLRTHPRASLFIDADSSSLV
jgi:glucosamine-6-phosphate deaminase